MTHKDLQKRVTNILTRNGNAFNIVSSNRRGRPDIVGHIGALYIAVEVKVGRDKARPAQVVTAQNSISKGGISLILHEKHLKEFEDYVLLIEEQIKANLPIQSIGKPIPTNLLPPSLDGVADFSAQSL